MSRMIRGAACFMAALLLWGGAAGAEVAFTWAGAFPAQPALRHHAYRAAAAEIDPGALADKLWPGGKWTVEPFGDGDDMYALDAANNPRGRFTEHLVVWGIYGQIAYSWEYNESVPPKRDIGGYEAALAAGEAFLRTWLPEEMLSHPLPGSGGFDEDGNPFDQHYELRWAQQVEPGVRAEAMGEPAGVRADQYSHGTSSVVVRWMAFEPADEGMEIPEYLTAERALASLNHAAGRAGGHTSFDDPGDRLVAIDPMFSDAFELGAPLRFCWAFTLRDARKGYLWTVLVDAATGDVFDPHDGRLEGLPG